MREGSVRLPKDLLLLLLLFCLVLGALAQNEININLSGLNYPLSARDSNIQGDVRFLITDPKSRYGWRVLDGHSLLAQAAEEHMKTWWYKDLKPGTKVIYGFKIIPNGDRDKDGRCFTRSGPMDKAQFFTRYSPGSELKKGRVNVDEPAVYIIVGTTGRCADMIESVSTQ